MPSWIPLDIDYQTYSEIQVVSAPAIPQRQDINEDNIGYYNAGRHVFKTS
jgi:hypothetical protein